MLNNSTLHFSIMKSFVETGMAPKVEQLATAFNCSTEEIIAALKALEDIHGVVLHPHSSEVWVMHPFSTAPTNFYIESGERSWWGNCAWCSLGAAFLLDRDLTITTTLGAQSQQVIIEVKNGQLTPTNLYVHFPIPMQAAWDNVIYTCSTMLLFESQAQIDKWCQRHQINKGDVQPIEHVWEFAKVWYGNHLNPEWEKWSLAEAKTIFDRFNLTHDIWSLPCENKQF
ncbi:alkylmercury lyase family protein [Pseudoalteromonas luteoviolacea]|uniref:alkylmercury lyase family protein n=1 Tax=Pseudoalteromonas luteoviolacea TaxID=43657 RepID=UPI0032B50C1C